ncbi:MAG: hypothetical protein R2854_22570 [Caldilineaceae bacterium]
MGGFEAPANGAKGEQMNGEPAIGQQVVIHIEELVVHGVDVDSRRRLGAAVEAEPGLASWPSPAPLPTLTPAGR